jgi:hypothetical protein
LPKNGASSVEIDFFETLTQHLGDTYVKLAGMSLLTIRLAVFVRREHYYKISHLKVRAHTRAHVSHTRCRKPPRPLVLATSLETRAAWV